MRVPHVLSSARILRVDTATKVGTRGILAGMEGITGKKAVDSITMTVKN